MLSQFIQHHIIKFPPPNFTICLILLGSCLFSLSAHTWSLQSDPNILILVSSDYKTLFQSFTVHSRCLSANSNLALLCFLVKRGFFYLDTAIIPVGLSTFLTVWGVICWLLTVDRTLAACTAVLIFLVQILHLTKVILVIVSFLG